MTTSAQDLNGSTSSTSSDERAERIRRRMEDRSTFTLRVSEQALEARFMGQQAS